MMNHFQNAYDQHSQSSIFFSKPETSAYAQQKYVITWSSSQQDFLRQCRVNSDHVGFPTVLFVESKLKM